MVVQIRSREETKLAQNRHYMAITPAILLIAFSHSNVKIKASHGESSKRAKTNRADKETRLTTQYIQKEEQDKQH